MLKTVAQIGNSLGGIFPSEFIRRNNLKKGSKMAITHSNGSITFATKLPSQTVYDVAGNQEWLELLKEVESKYGKALETLAKLQ
ncbi:MAG: hypothetical protein AAB768_02545 [Patescibacteria group bacterium]